MVPTRSRAFNPDDGETAVRELAATFDRGHCLQVVFYRRTDCIGIGIGMGIATDTGTSTSSIFSCLMQVPTGTAD
jgi:hypothetical protein